MPDYLMKVSGSARVDLPASFTREIGRIIICWARFEYAIQETVWQTLDVEQAEGRLAIREPRVTDRLEMLRDLVEFRKAEWDTALFTSILSRARLLSAKRDLVAHGIWGYHGGWHAQLARGTWPKNLRDLVAGSRKVVPEMVPLTIADLRDATNAIEQLTLDFRKLRKSTHGPPRPSPRIIGTP